MAFCKILIVICTSWILVESKWSFHHKRDISSSLCDAFVNNTNKIQCYCTRHSLKLNQIKNAECFLTVQNVKADDLSWDEFKTLQNVSKLELTNTKGILLKYVPTKALEQTKGLTKLVIKYGNIEKIQSYAFANLPLLEEITVRDNNIKVLEKHSFAHLKNVTSISLDTNDIEEINRDVFVDLPLLDKLFLTGNKITTIHDRAFINLINLTELEIDKNNLFSLNSETFTGLSKLIRLDLSSNSLEVIGANTFIHLVNLRLLVLDGNRIQMLDEKAFNGLQKLNSLSLAYNKLTDIDNAKTFVGLDHLTTLNLKDNQIRELKAEVMAPIINNFYGTTSYLNIEGNKFPCECRLDWTLSVKNKTQNNMLKNSLTNLKCYPDEALKESWKRVAETEKNEAEIFEDEEPQAQNVEYEYYDESQLNGTLFYTDVRFLLNCSNGEQSVTNIASTTPTPTKVTSSPKTTFKVTITTANPTYTTKVENQGLLDLSILETSSHQTTSSTSEPKLSTENVIFIGEKVNGDIDKKLTPTTTRLATVSAKPINKGYDDRDMASDEAKPDKVGIHKSYHQELKKSERNTNNAQRNLGCVSTLISIIIILSLRAFL